MCQQVQASLLPAVRCGYLTFVLVTVIPDPREALPAAWEQCRQRRRLLIDLAHEIPGLFGFFIALETHGAAHAKGKKKRKNPDAQEAAYRAEMEDPELDVPVDPQTDPTGPGKLAGKPHFHLLLYYPRLCTTQYNISYFKQLVQQRMENSDVNEAPLRDDHRRSSADPDFVRSCTYVLKGNNCPATRRYWQRHVEHFSFPPLPEFFAGPKFGLRENALVLEESRRFLAMIKALPNYCCTHISLELADAPPSFGKAIKLSKAGQTMLLLSNIMHEHGLFVGGDDCDRFYAHAHRVDYQVQCTYEQKYTLATLKTFLTTLPAAVDLVINYGSEMKSWFLCSQFDRLPPPDYAYVELRDAIYGIRTGLYYPKSDKYVCFRAYPYTQEQLARAEPNEWLQLVDKMCASQLVIKGPPRDVWSQPKDKTKLLMYLAYLLRPRLPKQKVLYLWGESNCGKTTLISFLFQLYPKEAIGFLNRSCVALSGIHERVQCIIADEFDVNSIPRSELLKLTDGAQLLDVRKMHQDARLIENPHCSMVFNSNKAAKYKDDDSQALKNRFEMFHCENVLKEDKQAQLRVFAEHLVIVAWLNRLLRPLEEQAERVAVEDAEYFEYLQSIIAN